MPPGIPTCKHIISSKEAAAVTVHGITLAKECIQQKCFIATSLSLRNVPSLLFSLGG